MAKPVAVVGAGVIGLTLALRLLEAGRDVTIYDDTPLGMNASGVAAGMLAPASEALGDGVAAFERLRRARDLWPDLAQSIGCRLYREGATHLVAPGEGERRLLSLWKLGARASLYAVRNQAWDSVHTGEDWRLSALTTLVRLRHTVLARGGVWRKERFDQSPMGPVDVVIAGGWSAHELLDLAPELRWLEPIKGQILRLSGGPRTGPVIRAEEVYLVPDPDGLIVGATMEYGRSDTGLDPSKLQALQAAAVTLDPALADFGAQAFAGVRASTPDGWPLVGPSVADGVWLAVGARRNGWLLAPLIAEMLGKLMDGSVADDDALAFAPARFATRLLPARA